MLLYAARWLLLLMSPSPLSVVEHPKINHKDNLHSPPPDNHGFFKITFITLSKKKKKKNSLLQKIVW